MTDRPHPLSPTKVPCRPWPYLVAGVLILVGCRPASTPPSPHREPNNRSPQAILQRMLATYRRATCYADQGVVRLRYSQQGARFQDEAPLSLRAERPNRLRLQAYRAIVVCDGTHLMAQVEDKETGNIDGQILVRAAPAQLRLGDLYGDVVLREALSSGLARQPVQAELLYGEQPLAALFQPGVSLQLLPSQEFDGRACDRVQATTAEGHFVFWIDREDALLRRLEYPVRSFIPEMAEDVADAELAAEFVDARVDEPFSGRSFQFSLPKDAKQVSFFVLPPRPLPSGLLGTRPARFSLIDMQAGLRRSEELIGRIVVLIWFADHPACRASLQQLSAAYRVRFQKDRRIEFFAVCTEPTTRSNDDVRRILEAWDVDLPVLRDLQACGRDVFQIPGAPTVVVLDATGVVQVFQVGANPRVGEELPAMLDRLLAGDDLAREILTRRQEEQQWYAERLAAAQRPRPPPAAADVLPRSLPRRLPVEPLWSSSGATRPGNLLVIEEPDKPRRILVHDGPQAVVELDGQGAVAERHGFASLGDPVDYLRTAVDARGRRFYAAAAVRGPGVHVFDARWRPVFKYPTQYQHDGIADVQFADLDRDGELEVIVGFCGGAGIHCISVQGKEKWTYRSPVDALSVVVERGSAGANGSLLVSGQSGAVLRLDGAGRPVAPLRARGRPVFHLFGSCFEGQAATAYCGLTFHETGNLVALGLDAQLEEVWEHTLPSGTFQNPVQFVAAGRWGGGWLWAIGAPDGTIHLVRDDGALRDHFAYGLPLAGLALAGHGEACLLFVAAGQRVDAWVLREGPPGVSRRGVRGNSEGPRKQAAQEVR